MKKIFLTFLFLLYPCATFAQLDVYLSTQNLPFGKDVWTSESYPDSWSSEIQIEHYFHREEFPWEYQFTPQEIRDLIDGLFLSLTDEERQEIYSSLLDFEKQQLLHYIAIAISPDTENNISDKLANGFLITPFESSFQNCAIDINQRRSIARDFITDIHGGVYSDINTVEYTNIRFGDCIIPFPDARRGSSVIADSFPSNQLIAESLWWNPLIFWTLEDSVNLFSLSNLALDGSYTWVQESNLLDLKSTRVEDDEVFEKQVGKSKILYVHQNHYTNIFKDTLITGNDTIGYTVWGLWFNVSHPLFISSSDSETKRTLSWWQEFQEWIYRKTLIQDDTFEMVWWVYVPKQNVGLTSYYAIIYNYDTSPPVCSTTLYSHDSAGSENFIFPENPWFSQAKYGYFVCWDDESACFCDSSITGCFLRDNIIFSTPQEIPHSGTFQYRFWNRAGLSQLCTSPVEQELFYDTINPDIQITLPGIPNNSQIREYVNNAWVLYDGREVAGKKFYNITNELSFQADESINMQFELFDPYDIWASNQWISWLNSYILSISEFENNNWVERIQQNYDFEDYNPLGTLNTQHTHTFDLQSLENIEDVVTKIGRYQIKFEFDDAAWNETRVILYFTIIPWDISITNSSLEIIERNTIYANNSDSYIYSLLLRDEYLNPVSWRPIVDIQHTCVWVSNCSELRLDMTGMSPSWAQALEIFNMDTISNSDWRVNFSLRSKVPGRFNESFRVDSWSPISSLLFTAQDNVFLAPIIGTLEARVSWNWVSDQLPIDQMTEFRVRIEDIQTSWFLWSLSDFTAYIQARHPDTEFTLSWPLTSWIDGVYFSWIFASSLAQWEKHKTLLEIKQDTRSGIIISYIVWWDTVMYRLSSHNLSSEILQLGNTGELQNPVKIIWNLQGVWNTHNLSERQNMTGLDTYVFRNMLRKNVGSKINKRIDDTEISGVKYIDKTHDVDKLYILESDPSFETLIVRNGNIHIREDFNVSWKKVGLISYIDSWYNNENGFENIWNIYIEPNVTSISAIMYADGALISTQSWTPISWDVNIRNGLLQNQLTIFGSIFTRNTLAGGRELAWNYMLSGWEMTPDELLARQYDLYYIRRGNTSCTQDAYGFCDIIEYLIIEYDPRVISSPPEFFEEG